MTDIIQPDYARLKNSLLTSGVQKSNNALYQILDQLIKVSEQTQIAQKLNINPLGALESDPLGVRVDNVTIQVRADNKLIAIPTSTGETISKINFLYTQADALAANRVNILNAPGSGKIHVVWGALAHSKFTRQYGTSQQLIIGYDTTFTTKTIISMTNVIVGGISGAVEYWVYAPNVSQPLYDGIGGPATPINKAVQVKAATTNSVGSGSPDNTHKLYLFYSTIDVSAIV